jgi:hypothetical protein
MEGVQRGRNECRPQIDPRHIFSPSARFGRFSQPHSSGRPLDRPHGEVEDQILIDPADWRSTITMIVIDGGCLAAAVYHGVIRHL